jgi:hypothetical protein
MVEKNSIDLDDPLAIAGTRVLEAPRYLVWKVWTPAFPKWQPERAIRIEEVA